MKLLKQNSEIHRKNEEEEDITSFQKFSSTYRILCGLLSIAVMYPNKNTDKWRLIAIVIVGMISTPFVAITTIDVIRFFMENNLANVIRLVTVSGPFSLVVVKMTLLYYKRRNAEIIIEEIERDYAFVTNASEKIYGIVHNNIRRNLAFEKFWTICVFTSVFTFPLSAWIMNIYSNMTKDENRYMITDLRVPFVEEAEARFSSPYFEIMNGYTFFICCLYFIYFTCYELFIIISIGHGCLKFELFNAALEDAILVPDARKRNKMVKAAVREQMRALWYVDVINDTFNIWLGFVTVASLGQLCCCMFYILEGYGFDERYCIFTITVIIYIYLICYRAHELRATAEEIPFKIFSNGWHSTPDVGLWKSLTFMIARSQKPIEIRAFHFFLFDMDFFVFIVKTAYSMFTLLKK